MDWADDLPEWIAAIVAALALVAAGVAAYEAWRLRGIEQRRDDERQAAAVAAWVATRDEPGPRPTFVEFVNASSVPVHDVVVDIDTPRGDAKPLRLGLLPPGGMTFRQTTDSFGWDLGARTDQLDAPLRPVVKGDKWCVASFAFTDARGVRWRRDHTGPLQRVAEGAASSRR